MALPTTFEIELRFLSDWHVGTGQGRLGTIDAEVRRDAAGLPFVPAKTLVGVWRDACETVAGTLDRAGDPPGAWQAWVTWLFGSDAPRAGAPPVPAAADTWQGGPPVPAALRLTPANAPGWLRAAVRTRPALAQAAVVLRPGVRIDDATGTAADRLLRVEERAIRDLRLHSTVSIVAGAATGGVGVLAEPAELLLRAGARLVEAVGGKRSRGSGRVAVLLPGAEVDTGVHPRMSDPHLDRLLAPGVPAAPAAPPAPADPVQIHPYGRLHPDRPRTLRIVLRVLTPVVAAADVLGNMVSSRDMIPGTALLGTVLARAEPASTGAACDKRIGLGEIGAGDAVPAIGDPAEPATAIPARPVPMVWRRGGKGRGTTVYNTLVAAPAPDDQAKAMSGWIAPDGHGWREISPALDVSTHAVIDDQARRPTTAGGGVYTYLGIAPGTLLCTDIVLPAGVRLRLAPGERLRFGRSRKDDFGLVEVAGVIDPLPPPAPAAHVPGPLRVWCVSDVLLRDERLAPDPSPAALGRALSAALAPASVEVDTDATACAVTRRDGFGVAWGRPRQSQVALRAGSVVSFTATGPLDPGRLAELERDGIGERTAEGYGRIRFNPPELAVPCPAVAFTDEPLRHGAQQRCADPEPPVDCPEIPVDTVELPVNVLEKNAWRRAIRRNSAALHPNTLVPGISRMADHRAQLGALRTQLERLTEPDGTDLVRAWLHATEAVPDRQQAWGQEVLTELRMLLLDDPDRIWCRLGLDGQQPRLVLRSGREDAVRQRLHTEALVTAVTDALRRLNRGGYHSQDADEGSSTAEGPRR
jgi:CRISPR-associated protein Csx10